MFDPSRILRAAGRSLFLGSLAVFGLNVPAGAQAPDPFTPHLRWRHAPDSGASWLPRSVAFAHGSDLVWASGSLADPRLFLLAGSATLAPARSLSPLETFDLPGAFGPGTIQGDPRVVPGPGPEAMLALVQVLASDGASVRSSLARFDALQSAGGGAFGPHWIHGVDGGVQSAAMAAPAGDGASVWFAVQDGASGALTLERLDALGGTVLASASLQAGTLRRLEASDDGGRVAFVVGARLVLLGADGSPLLDLVLPQPTNALALSGDGATIAVGSGDEVRRLVHSGGAWADAPAVSAPPGELPVRLALDRDGATLAVGWWNAASAKDVRFELLHGAPPVRVLEVWQPGGDQGQQNFPAAVRLTPDGRRAAFGAWGADDSQAELFLFDRDSASTLLAIDLPGSVQDLALDETGRRLAVALKHGHAGQPAASGEVRVYGTGEEDLQVLGTPRIGGELHVASLQPGARWTSFLLGPRLEPGLVVPGALGVLAIDRSALLGRIAVPANGAGRADLILSVPADPALVGKDFAVQAVSRIGGVLQFTDAVVEPLVL